MSVTPNRPVAPAVDLRGILTAAGDSVLARSPNATYAANASTAEALGPAARGQGRVIATTAEPVWCEDRAGTGRVVGIVVALGVDSVAGDRATVSWSATCLMTPPGDTTPGAFGAAGTYEVMRSGGQWRATRSLAYFAL